MKEIEEIKEIKEVQEIKPERLVDKMIEDQKKLLSRLRGKIPTEIYNAMRDVSIDIITCMDNYGEDFLSMISNDEDLMNDSKELLSCLADNLGINRIHEIPSLEQGMEQINFSQLVISSMRMLRSQAELVEKFGNMSMRSIYGNNPEYRETTIKSMNDILHVICDVKENDPIFSEDYKKRTKADEGLTKTENKAKVNTEETTVVLNTYLSSLLNKTLKEMNIEHKGVKFPKGLLDMITSLEIDVDKGTNLQGIEQLTSLQSLSIFSGGRTEGLLKRNFKSITQEDMEYIYKCKSLKELSIKNQALIRSIDVSTLENLEMLDISYNQYLEDICGLDKLKKLDTLTIFGNNRLFSQKGLNEVILNNENLYRLNLDVLMFPEAIGFDKKTGKYDALVLKKIAEIGTQWYEQINGNVPEKGRLSTLKMGTTQMIMLHNKACAILQENIPRESSKMDTVIGIENYLAQNVRYDYGGMKTHTSTSENGQQQGQKGGTNGVYNALMFNQAVCEGYTHAMQYLLKLRGIRSHNVACFGLEPNAKISDEMLYKLQKMSDSNAMIVNDNELPLNHSIICIDGLFQLYDDPTWNAIYYQKGDKSFSWLLKKKSEILKDHFLSPGERGIEDTRSPNKGAIRQSIESNDAFKRTRTSDLNRVFGRIRHHIERGDKLVIEAGDGFEK